jgi:hypothetical protein
MNDGMAIGTDRPEMLNRIDAELFADDFMKASATIAQMMSPGWQSMTEFPQKALSSVS